MFIPGLLMLATFGLERLESSLNRDTVRADDVEEFLEQADRAEVDTLARDGMPTALDSFHQRRAIRAACYPPKRRAQSAESAISTDSAR